MITNNARLGYIMARFAMAMATFDANPNDKRAEIEYNKWTNSLIIALGY